MLETKLLFCTELQVDVEWNSTYMVSFLGKNMLPVYVHRTSTNPPVTIEDISMFPGGLVEASVAQVQLAVMVQITQNKVTSEFVDRML